MCGVMHAEESYKETLLPSWMPIRLVKSKELGQGSLEPGNVPPPIVTRVGYSPLCHVLKEMA
jgi:hypothetical protein